MPDATPTRDRLIETAAALIRRKGYAAVGISEILAEAGVPKGSLYHHFPNGKADLAHAAATWASTGMLRVIDDAFTDAASAEDGIRSLCHKIAKFFDISDHRDGCPVAAVLFQGAEVAEFEVLTARIFEDWIDAMAAHAIRLGQPAAAAREMSETLLLAIEGGWVLARARRDSDILRSLPDRLGHGAGRSRTAAG